MSFETESPFPFVQPEISVLSPEGMKYMKKKWRRIKTIKPEVLVFEPGKRLAANTVHAILKNCIENDPVLEGLETAIFILRSESERSSTIAFVSNSLPVETVDVLSERAILLTNAGLESIGAFYRIPERI